VRDASGQITHFISNDRDITERRRLEAQLLQATKMDAIGQLAGGVAHDFNNLLMVISSYAELAIDSLTPGHALRHNLDEILGASRRAADLTRQLLAFSRKQMQSLQVLDLNAVVQDLGRMLPRLIGEGIQLTLISGKDLGKIKADPVQMEQIIMNLAANARDAMPHGGKLTIETSNIHLDEEYIHKRPIVPLGEYVLLSVTDSGEGIPPEHLPRIFEPFFTTKEKGKGTGLGLATVYGIVKQSGGYIWVYSEAGLGTIFKIDLPQVGGAHKKHASVTRAAKETPKGSETLLFVEDEDAVRRAACEFLAMCGYNVLEARDGTDAIQVANAYASTIHLLVTDVVVPHLGGSQVAQQLAKTRPEMKVLYVSGYASPTLLQHGVHAGETMFLQKPFTLKMLAWKIGQASRFNRASISKGLVPTATFEQSTSPIRPRSLRPQT
jgi:nitrogen-specific signal transduction histidine kinase/CheY-like chemotaxis protein